MEGENQEWRGDIVLNKHHIFISKIPTLRSEILKIFALRSQKNDYFHKLVSKTLGITSL